MSEQDPGELAKELEQQADHLERHSDEVQEHLGDAREDWQRKRRDENVPGAPPPDADENREQDSPIGAEEDPPPEARREG